MGSLESADRMAADGGLRIENADDKMQMENCQ